MTDARTPGQEWTYGAEAHAALKRESVQAAVENAVQLILVNPTGKSFQDDADDWAASTMDIGAFVETITNHVMALLTPPPPASR